MAQKKDGKQTKKDEKKIDKTGKLQKRGIQKRGVVESRLPEPFVKNEGFFPEYSDA